MAGWNRLVADIIQQYNFVSSWLIGCDKRTPVSGFLDVHTANCPAGLELKLTLMTVTLVVSGATDGMVAQPVEELESSIHPASTLIYKAGLWGKNPEAKP